MSHPERLGIEPRAHSVQHRRDVLAHRGPVRAGAAHPDVSRFREQSLRRVGHDAHHPLGQPTLEQLDQRTDLPGAAGLQARPMRRRQRRDLDLDVVRLRSGPGHHRFDPSRLNLQIDTRGCTRDMMLPSPSASASAPPCRQRA